MTFIEKYKPGVAKFWLYFTAALVWSGVGIYLISLAIIWLLEVRLVKSGGFIGAGLVLAAAFFALIFKRFSGQNITRIRELHGERICFFAFQRWTSYPLVVIMMSMGIYLRLYSTIPKPYLAILYIGIGSSLVFASLGYYRILLLRDAG